MPVELMKTHVDVNEMTKRENTQIVKERDMIVPDGKPDMQRVIYLDGKINMDQVDVQPDRVVYKGQVDVTILYVADNNKDVYTMRGSIPLEDFIIIDGIDPDQRVEFDYSIEHMHWNILNERKLNVKAIIEMGAGATKSKEVTMVTDITSDAPVQTRMKNVDIVKQSGTKEEKIIVKDEITIPQGKSSIGEILCLNTRVREEQIKRTDNEILFNGVVEIDTLYKSQDNENGVEVFTNRIPFAGNADSIKADNEMAWECELEVHPTNMQINPDYDGEDRIIELECIVTARYSTFDKINEQVIEDIYCPGKRVDIKENVEEYMTLVSRADVTSTKKEVISLEDTTPENNEIFNIHIKPMIDEKNIQGDKLTISGMLEVKTTYTNKEGINPVETSITMVPFNQELSIESIDKKPYLDVKVVPKDIQVLNQGRGEVTIEYVLNYIANVYTRENLSVLEDIALVDMDKQILGEYPSITVYVARKGDSLWDIAKRFNTTVNDIVEINGLEDSGILNQGQKIIVLKKVKF
ncbi:MAG: DUF3794 domain-containing protein [Cellulosilyticaceae bacterium]